MKDEARKLIEKIMAEAEVIENAADRLRYAAAKLQTDAVSAPSVPVEDAVVDPRPPLSDAPQPDEDPAPAPPENITAATLRVIAPNATRYSPSPSLGLRWGEPKRIIKTAVAANQTVEILIPAKSGRYLELALRTESGTIKLPAANVQLEVDGKEYPMLWAARANKSTAKPGKPNPEWFEISKTNTTLLIFDNPGKAAVLRVQMPPAYIDGKKLLFSPNHIITENASAAWVPAPISRLPSVMLDMQGVTAVPFRKELFTGWRAGKGAVSADEKEVLVTIPAGSNVADFNGYYHLPEGAVEAAYQIDVLFDEGFNPWNQGGKLTGMGHIGQGKNGTGGHSGARSDGTNGWSERINYNKSIAYDGHPFADLLRLNLYSYHMDQRGNYGDHQTLAAGPHCYPVRGRWHTITMHMRVNSLGKADGFVRVFIDDIPALSVSNRRYRTTDDLWIKYVMLTFWFGGLNKDHKDPLKFRLRNLRVKAIDRDKLN